MERVRSVNATGARWNGIDSVQCEKGKDTLTLTVELLCPADPASGILDGSQWKIRPTGANKFLSNLKFVITQSDSTAELTITATVIPTTTTKTNGTLPLPGEYELSVSGDHIDPQYDRITFTIQPDPPGNQEPDTPFDTDIDPKPRPTSTRPKTNNIPDINYLAKDYQTFRRLILDRLAFVIPDWQARNPSDLGITLVELLAYVGDYLSYYQDAVATDAYLNTSRQRISVRRHARLVDYELSEGSNARTFLSIEVANSIRIDPKNVFFITRLEDRSLASKTVLFQTDLENLSPTPKYVGFEAIDFPKRKADLEVADIKNAQGFLDWLEQDGAWLSSQMDQIDPLSSDDQLLTPEEQQKKQLANVLEKLNHVLKQTDLREIARGTASVPSSLIAQVQSSSEDADAGRSLLDLLIPQLISIRKPNALTFEPALNQIPFYTWDQDECCLPIGTTKATLMDGPISQSAPVADPPTWLEQTRLQSLRRGSTLIFEEIIGPRTGVPEDADPGHRQAVRITRVTTSQDPVTGQRLLEIEWDPEDALVFPLCLSARLATGNMLVRGVSVARGNILPVDHGVRVAKPEMNCVPSQTSSNGSCDQTASSSRQDSSCSSNTGITPSVTATTPPNFLRKPKRFEFDLAEPDLTFAVPVENWDLSAKGLLNPRGHRSQPSIEVFSSSAAPLLDPDQFSLSTCRTDSNGDVPSIPTCQPLLDFQSQEALLSRLNSMEPEAIARLERWPNQVPIPLSGCVALAQSDDPVGDNAEVANALDK
ncbi:MAG: hypothetical protein WCH39_24885, partial [Schlesneria sp.]